MRCEVDPPGFLVSSCYGRLPERIQSISKNQTGGWARNTEIQPVSTAQTRFYSADTRTRDDGVERSGNMFSFTSHRHQQLMKSEETIMIKVKINGQERSWDGDPDLPLLWTVIDGLAGDRGVVGIHDAMDETDQQPARDEIGLARDHAVQKAWREMNVPQCGYCQAGQIMQAAALLMENPKPNHDQIREAMAGNICRCGTYQRIENAVNLASTGV